MKPKTNSKTAPTAAPVTLANVILSNELARMMEVKLPTLITRHRRGAPMPKRYKFGGTAYYLRGDVDEFLWKHYAGGEK